MSENKKKIEEYIQKYPSVRNWFLKRNGERRYKPVTEKANLECLELWCRLLNKNPDELVPSNLKEAELIQTKIIAKLLEPPLYVKESVILQHTTKYHSFCRFNLFKFPYGGDHLKNVIRTAKWKLKNESEER